MDNTFFNIPLEDLFPVMEYPTDRIPVRWWNMKTTAKYLEVSERTVRRYKADDKLEYKYSTVKGHRRVYFSNVSVIALSQDRRWKQMLREADNEDEDPEDDEEDLADEEVDISNAISTLLASLIK